MKLGVFTKKRRETSSVFEVIEKVRLRCYNAPQCGRAAARRNAARPFRNLSLVRRSMNTIKLNGNGVRMIAHRGLSGLEKENTCSAFVAAGNRERYFGVETDVHKTKDGRFVIFHDDSTERVGLDAMVVENSTFDTLRKLQLTDIDGKRGRADLIIPTLEEYIEICKKYEKVCVLELKNEFRPADIYKITGIFEKADYLDHLIIISFQLKNLIALRRRFPDLPAQYLLQHWHDDTLAALEKHRLGLDIHFPDLTAEIVRQVHGAGLEVNCWTVNTPEDGQAMLALGVDYITTNILE